MTKRLKICDAEIENLNNKEVQLNQTTKKAQTQDGNTPNQSEPKLPTTGLEYLKEVEILLRGIKEGN